MVLCRLCASLCRFCTWCRTFSSLRRLKPQSDQENNTEDVPATASRFEADSKADVISDVPKDESKLPYSDAMRIQASASENDEISNDHHPQLRRVRSIFDTPPPSPQ